MTSQYPFFLMRHGLTPAGNAGRFQGHLDEKLTEQGRQQAVAAARWIGGQAGLFRGSRLVSSPLARAFETAQIVATHAGVWHEEPFGVEALGEMCFGDWEGMTTHEVKQRFPEQRRARKADRWNFAPPGGESYADLAERAGQWMDDLDGPVFAVAHSGIIRVMVHLTGTASRQEAMALEAGHCSLWRWDCDSLRQIWGLP